ncbi:MAG: substrate-binding domain-containing protein [Actinobacteria bacterium]|nr:substrate-binding domain-containing protein [Actinomycetota bacterium]
MRKTFATVIALTSALAIAACSSSGSGTSNSSGTSTSTSGGGSGSSSSGVAAAKAYEQQFLNTPTSVGISTTLKSKPAAGKVLIGLDSGLGSAKVLAQYWAQAAADAGWTYKDLISGTTPSAQQAAFNSAIQQNPAGILTSGIPEATISSGLTLAQQKGIWVNSSATTDPPKGAMFDTSIANPDQLHQWGKMVAAYVVTQSNGNANIADFSLPVFPILFEFDKAFIAAIHAWCPSCKVSEHPQQGSDIGTKTPQSVVSTVTRDPSIKWLIFDLGDLETGVNAALSAAGLHGLHIGGLTADVPNIQALKNKTQDVWTAYSLPIVAYRQVDSFARKFENMPTLTAALPTQLLTQDNINSMVADPALNYVGVADYRTQFKKLWLVGS